MIIRQIWNRIKNTGITPFLPIIYAILWVKDDFLGWGRVEDAEGTLMVGPLPLFLFVYGLARVIVHSILYEGLPLFSKQTEVAKVFFDTFTINDGTLSLHNCNCTAKWSLNEVKNGNVELYSSRGGFVTNVEKMFINNEKVETSAKDRLKIRTFILETKRFNKNSGITTQAQSLAKIAEARQGVKEARLRAELAELVRRREEEALSSGNFSTLTQATQKVMS